MQQANNGKRYPPKGAMAQLPGRVYYVESADDSAVLVAMQVTLMSRGDGTYTISWLDTIKDRGMRASSIWREGESFAFRRVDSEGGQTYRFTPMTLEIYEEKVRENLIAGQHFDDLESLYQTFESIDYW